MLRVPVCAAHMGGFLGPKFSKQGSLFRQIFHKQGWVIKKLAKNSKKWVVFRKPPPRVILAENYPFFAIFRQFLDNPPLFMENLPKKGPLFRESWAQKPTHMGGTYSYPQYVMLPPPPCGKDRFGNNSISWFTPRFKVVNEQTRRILSGSK